VKLSTYRNEHGRYDTLRSVDGYEIEFWVRERAPGLYERDDYDRTTTTDVLLAGRNYGGEPGSLRVRVIVDSPPMRKCRGCGCVVVDEVCTAFGPGCEERPR